MEGEITRDLLADSCGREIRGAFGAGGFIHLHADAGFGGGQDMPSHDGQGFLDELHRFGDVIRVDNLLDDKIGGDAVHLDAGRVETGP